MTLEFQLNNSADKKARFITWAPSPCSIRISNPAGVSTPSVTLKLSAKAAAGGGGLAFRTRATGAFTSSMTLSVPASGAAVPFFVAGKFGQPSTNADDVTIEARAGTSVVGSIPLMVRIRKNANKLSRPERDRFVAAMAQLNNRGAGLYQTFRDMHSTSAALRQAHGFPGFLPWHRAYLLQLERELQAIDPAVTLPYWRFDQAAANLFTPDFLGASDALGTVNFSAGNPLRFWVTDGVPGINRRPLFSTAAAPGGLATETQTLALGSAYGDFVTMEGDPHGLAHTSFGGSIQSPPTAPKDPLFFLLHCNVDRLWAKWQKRFGRFDPAVAASFVPGGNPVGHNLNDTMWPWNGVTTPPRPPTAPGGPMPASPVAPGPGPKPRVSDCLDFQGAVSSAASLGFAYDDVPFV